MIVGCPKEIKPQEGRVGLLPFVVAELVRANHTVLIQQGAGANAAAPDAFYQAAGAQIVEGAEEIYARAGLIIKVKEPMPSEYPMIRKGQVIFTYFHFASSRELTKAMVASGAICIAYETVETHGRLPLLEPMSEVAGRMAIQEGMRFLEAPQGGRGTLLGGVPGVKHGKVVIIGGGVVGFNAAKVAAGVGADVVVLDRNLDRIRYLEDVLPPNCTTRYSCEDVVREEIRDADLVICAVLLPGRLAPKIVRREHIKLMQPGSIIVDVAIDHGGCCETSEVTYHHSPTFIVDGVVHYCVANMPGAVPITSTTALANATTQYILDLANLGWKESCAKFPALFKGLNVACGKIVHQGVAEAFNIEWEPAENILGNKADE